MQLHIYGTGRLSKHQYREYQKLWGHLSSVWKKTVKSFWISRFHTVLIFCSVSENYNHLNWFLNGHWTFCGLKLTFQESKMLQSDRCLNCVTKSLNLFKKSKSLQLHRARFGLCRIWIVQVLDCARFGSWKIWIVQGLDFAIFGSHKIWIAKYQDLANLVRAKFGLCVIWIV